MFALLEMGVRFAVEKRNGLKDGMFRFVFGTFEK
jgi:hypothetical protein